MAIAKLLKTEIVTPRDELEPLIKTLEGEKLFHIEDIHDSLEEELSQWENKITNDTSEIDQTLLDIKWVLDIFKTFNPISKGLLEEFFGSAPYIEEQEFTKVLEGFDFPSYVGKLREKYREYENTLSELEKNREIVQTLSPWEGIDVELSIFSNSKYVTIYPVVCSKTQLSTIEKEIEENNIKESVEWVVVKTSKKELLGYFIALNTIQESFESILKTSGVRGVTFPDIEKKAKDAIDEAYKNLSKLEEERLEYEKFFREEAEKNRAYVEAYHDEYANRKKNIAIKSKIYHANIVSVVRGWVREKDREKFEKKLTEKFKNIIVEFSKPTKEDNPPIFLENPRLLKPYQILIEMFGMPKYFGIDPTPLVAVAMTFFYAMVLGDVGYGFLQVLIAVMLKRKFKPGEGTRLFLDLFVEMGVVSIIFGFLTWSFFGTSFGYTYGGDKILGFLPLFSPTKDIMVIIGISIAVGVVFQLISILAGFVNAIKIGDIKAAIFDYFMWFVLLFAIIAWIATKAIQGIPSSITSITLLVMAISALGIVAFTGRDTKGIGGRLMMGVISLYGIVGYYGIVSFFSDVLSYMRLAVLNLTTGFIALVGNMMGGLLMGDGSTVFVVISTIIAVIIIVLFHVLNLLLSMLSAFVHSLRLNYLESFNRYYPSGGKQFIPFKRESQYYRFEK